MGQSTEELNTDIESTREDLSRNLDALNDRVSPSRVIQRRKDAAKGRLANVKDKVMGQARSGASSASSMTGDVADKTSSAAGSVTSTVQEKAEGSPLAAGLIAFGAGALVAAMMPASEKEAQAAQQVMDAAREHGQPVMDEAKSAGKEMGQHLKESGKQAAEEVKSTAQDSAQKVKDEGQTSAERIQP
jgi:hypothetical protein